MQLITNFVWVRSPHKCGESGLSLFGDRCRKTEYEMSYELLVFLLFLTESVKKRFTFKSKVFFVKTVGRNTTTKQFMMMAYIMS